MNAAQLLAHFDRLAEAPNAVPRLRRFILDLAVRGKLVEQDAGDEPATELLKRIESEIARLVTIGEMRKPTALPPIELGDEPFAAPSGWCWVRIRQVTSDRGQTTPTGEFTYIDVGSINKEAGVLGEHKVLSANDAPSRARKVVGKGDVLYSCVRPTLLNIAVVDDEITPTPIASTAFAVLNSFGLVRPRYLWIALRSTYLEAIVESGMRGQAYPAINDAEFALLPLALPPLAEQYRIVAKVDELMAMCDQLEAAQQERERRRDRLAAASLQRLDQPALDATPEAQREYARFHLQHLPRLTTQAQHIKAMRQSFLNLAVAGKLVEQSLEDESAAKFLQSLHLRALKRPADFVAHDVPETWSWATIDQLASVSSGTTPSRAESAYYSSNGIPWVTSGETSNDFITSTAQHVTQKALEETSLKLYPPGTLIVAMYGQGKTRGQIAELSIAATTNQACAAIVLKSNDVGHRRYVKLFFQKIYEEIRELAAGGAQPNLNGGKIKATLIPLPPIAEQHRIVAKVDELMAICAQLEVQLVTTEIKSRRLLEVFLDRALGIVRNPTAKNVSTALAAPSVEVLQIEKASRYMTKNPATTVDQLLECIDDLGGSAMPDRLLMQTGLGENVEAFYDLLRAARDSGKVVAPLGVGERVRRHSNAH